MENFYRRHSDESFGGESAPKESFWERRHGQEYKGIPVRPMLEVDPGQGVASAYGNALVGPEMFLAELTAKPGMSDAEIREMALDYRDKATPPEDLIDMPTYGEYLTRRITEVVEQENRRASDTPEDQAQKIARQLLGIFIRSDWQKIEKMDELVAKLRTQVNGFDFVAAESTAQELKKVYLSKLPVGHTKTPSPFDDPEIRRVLEIPEDFA